jgi:hypothetical protein
MKTIKLLSWHEDLSTKAALLKRAGLKIDSAPLISTSGVIGELARLNPAVLVFDLDKRPSYSREIALLLRSSKSARHIPILFAGGLPDKLERLRQENPEATYASWAEAPKALATLLINPPSVPPPIAPQRSVAATALPKKLGITANTQLALIAAPDGFEDLLGDLPTTTTRLTPNTDLALCFIRSLADLSAVLDLLTLRLPKRSSVWILHPKRTGRYPVDFNQNHVREASLAAGLVDYKVCSIDQDWSALKFAWRKR